MAVAALIVSIAAIVLGGITTYFGKRSADAATTATGIERQRRHAELRPRFAVTCTPANAGSDRRQLSVKLLGPGELEAIDTITVTIRDDSHFRLKPAPAPGQPPASVPDQVWGPLRFVPRIGPGVGTRPGAVGADTAGRATSSPGMPVGEEHVYALEPTPPPAGASWTTEQWQAQVGPLLRFRIESHKADLDPWIAVGEIDASGWSAQVETT